MTRRRLVEMLVAMLVLGAGPASCVTLAGPGDPKITTGGIHFGGMIAGPDVVPESLAGRVVLLELWGVQCPQCVETMPKLEHLHRTLGPLGLVVIGAHVQDGAEAEVRQAAAGLGVTFSIVGNTGIQGLPQTIPHLPYTLLFDHTGKCVFLGTALEVGPAAAAAVNAAPPLLLNGRELAKLVPLYPLLRNEGTFGPALKKARSMTSSKDEEASDEATFVVEKIEAWGRDVVDKAAEARKADPGAALERLQRCAAAFKGESLGADATKLVMAWKKDPAFRNELKCYELLARLEGLRSATGAGRVVTPEVAAAVPEPVKRQMKDLADAITKTAPGSRMAERAAEIALEFSLAAGAGP